MSPSGIDPATCLFVAQCLNHCATGAPTKGAGKEYEKDYIISLFISVLEVTKQKGERG
jgi:hypothetical protein